MLSDPVLSSLYVQVTDARRSELGTGWNTRNYSDEFCRLYYTESGEAFITHHAREFRLRPGWAMVIPAHTVISYHCPKAFVQHWVHFRAELFGGVSLFDYLQFSSEIEMNDSDRVFAILGRLREVFKRGDPGERFETNGLLLQLLAPFVGTSGSGGELHRQEGFLRFRKALEYIDAHMADPLQIEDLSTIANLERTYFSRSFKKHFGISPAHYIRQKRVERAKGLLWETDHTLDVIAEQLGFSDGFHFSKVFKSITGMPPKMFRARPRQVP